MIRLPLVAQVLSHAASMVLASVVLVTMPAYAGSQRSAGDILATAIPVGTLVTELFRGDRDGAWQYGLTFVATAASTEVLKRVAHVQRPDETNDQSFPSGHAARAFSAAAYLRQRHGLEVAAPLYLAALYVGHTRVAARRHRWTDVAGGALVSEAAAAFLVQRAPGSQLAMSVALARGYVNASATLSW